MDRRGTAGVHADVAVVGGRTTEFEGDVVDLLVATLRRVGRGELSVAGTDTLLGELVSGDTEAGEAIAPGMRKAGSLSGMIRGRAGRDWVSHDDVSDHEVSDHEVSGAAPVEVGADGTDGAHRANGADEEARREAVERAADEWEVDAVWREAWWRLGLEARGSAADRGRAPGMSGALRACLLLALRTARAEGTTAVRCRHVARALLDLPGSRAREALVLERLDRGAAAAALDGLDAKAAAETQGPESHGVTMLRRAGTLGKSGNRLTRALSSWTSGVYLNGSPVLFAVSVEAVRQAVRRGRAVAEPVDLLLGMLALDRALSVAGRSLPANLADVNAAAALLRGHGGRQVSLVASASASASGSGSGSGSDSTSAIPATAATGSTASTGATGATGATSATGPTTDTDSGANSKWLSAAADRVMAVARLSAAEHGSPTTGTVHLLSALLDESATEAGAGSEAESGAGVDAGAGAGACGVVVRLLAAERVDVAALRAELSGRLGA